MKTFKNNFTRTIVAVAALAFLAQGAAAKGKKGADQNLSDIRFERGSLVPQGFTGRVYFREMIPLDATYNFPQTNLITFEPGARSGWHVHGGMSVIGVGGVGYYQEEGKPAVIIRKGDVVQIPVGTRHWHGATADSWFQQIVIYDRDWKAPEGLDTHGAQVTDEEYKNLVAIKNPGRVKKADKSLTFARGKKLSLPTFTGKVYLSSVVGEENAAESPGLHYVVFPKGVYNAWHVHEGGQILIATDGIGYHQVEGGAVEVLHPGDVAFCPPGVPHWHGGSLSETFAHIAVNTNPEKTGLEWKDFLSAEEYRKLKE